jgi:hypothetical protein
MTAKITRPKTFVIFLAVLLVALSAAAQEKSYSYPGEGFRAIFPSEPELSKRDVPTDRGNYEVRTYIAADSTSGAYFTVAITDYGKIMEGKDPDVILQGAEDGALVNSKSHLVASHKKILLGTHHGLAFESETDELHLSIRLYMVGNSLYQTLVVYPKTKKDMSAASQRFFDSFQLIPRQ